MPKTTDQSAEVRKFVAELKRYNPTLERDIDALWDSARRGNDKDFYRSLLRVARAGQKVGQIDEIVNEG